MSENTIPETQPDPIQKVVDPATNTSQDAPADMVQAMLKNLQAENAELKKLLAGTGDKTNGPDAGKLAEMAESLRAFQNENDELKRLINLRSQETEISVGADTGAASGFKAKQFTYEKKKYRLLFPQANIPGMGTRTAAEILLDKEAQKYLIENKSGFISEVTE
jgi:hypothetical protein